MNPAHPGRGNAPLRAPDARFLAREIPPEMKTGGARSATALTQVTPQELQGGHQGNRGRLRAEDPWPETDPPEVRGLEPLELVWLPPARGPHQREDGAGRAGKGGEGRLARRLVQQ